MQVICSDTLLSAGCWSLPCHIAVQGVPGSGRADHHRTRHLVVLQSTRVLLGAADPHIAAGACAAVPGGAVSTYRRKHEEDSDSTAVLAAACVVALPHRALGSSEGLARPHSFLGSASQTLLLSCEVTLTTARRSGVEQYTLGL